MPDLLLLWPELGSFRDLIFLFKMFMCPEHDTLPRKRRWRAADARLHWSLAWEAPASKKVAPGSSSTTTDA